MRIRQPLFQSRLVSLCLLAGFAAGANAATIQVNSNADGGDAVPGNGTCGTGLPGNSCTLRAAIQEANANADASNTITFAAGVDGQTTSAGSNYPAITKSLAITGPASRFTVSGTNGLGNFSLLRYTGASGGTYSISNLNLEDAATTSTLGGAAVYVGVTGVTTITISDTTLSANEAGNGPGGAIAADLSTSGSSLALARVTLSGNTAATRGGGLWVRLLGTSSATIDHSTITGNDAANGGGIAVARGRLVVGSTTISGNSATAAGGGIVLEGLETTGGSVRLDNVTLSGNTAASGGALAVGSGTAVAASHVTFSTIVENSAASGGGLHAADATRLNTAFPGNASNPFTSNIVGDNTGGNCSSTLAHVAPHSGFNLTDDASCGFTTDNNDQIVASAAALKIAGLAANPVAPNTHALLFGSPAIDAGNPFWAVATDARNADVQDGNLDGNAEDPLRDIGSYEFGGLGLIQFGFAGAADTFTVNENAGPALVPIRRLGTGTAIATAPSVNFTTTAVSATAGACGTAGNDYTALSPNPTTFAFTASGANQLERTASLPICNDDVPEAGETIALALTRVGATGYDLGRASGTLTIVDNENGTFGFSATTADGLEGSAASPGSVVVTINRTVGTKGAVRVNYATTSTCTPACTAVAGTDYTAASGFVDFADGEASKAVTLNFIGDAAFEPGETFQIGLGSVACQGLAAGETCDARLIGAAADPGRTSRITITNDDVALPGSLQFSVASYTAAEADGTLTVTVKRVGGSDGAVSVDYSATDGTAVAGVGQDYFFTPLSTQTLDWANGDTADKTFTVNLVDDMNVESTKSFTLVLSNATGGAALGTPASAPVSLVSDEQPELAFTVANGAYSVAEGGTSIMLTVQAEAFTGPNVSVPYFTADGTATSPADFTGVPQATPGSLTFASGESKTITITVASDTTVEGNETFTVNLGTPVGGATVGGTNPATVTIVDPAAVRLTAATFASATEASASTITVTAERIGSSAGMLTVNFAITQDCVTVGPGCAEEAVDYTRAGGFTGSLSWNNLETGPKSFTITVLADTLIEGDESIAVSLNSPSMGAVLGTPSTGKAFVTDDDYRFEIVEVGPLAVGEGAGNATVSVRRVGSTLGAASVGFATADGTAVAGADYTETKSPPALSWAAGEGGTKAIAVPVTADAVDEADETLTLALNTPSNNVTGQATPIANSPLTLSITDDDAVTVAFSTDAQTVAESGSVSVTVTRTGDTTFALDVPFTVSGTSANPADHNAAAGSLTIPANQSSATYSFAVVADTRDEADETVVFTLGTPTGGTVTAGTPATHTVTITDNDAVTVAFSAPTQSVAENVGNVVVTVTRTGATDFAISVPVQLSGTGTASSPADHNGATGTVVIPANATSGSLSFAVAQDALDEPAETVVFTLGTPTGGSVSAAAPATQTITVADDDAPPAVSVADVAVTEGDTTSVTATFTVTLSAPSGQGVTVSVATADGTALAPDDYTAVPTTALTFAAGQTSRTVSVTVRSDSVDEATETFNVVLTTPINATLGDGTGTGTILDAADDVDSGNAGGGGGSFGLLGLGLLLPVWLRRRRVA